MKFFLTVIFLFVFAPFFAFGGVLKVESIEAVKDSGISESIKATLEEKGSRVTEDSKTIAEIWFAKKVANSGKEVMGANYGNIPEGSLLGVIHFSAETSDYRGQAVKAGFYTMRYAVILENGAHLGVSPTRDFFLLIPASDDKDTKSLTQAETIKLSTKTSGSGHPSPWSIVSPESKDGLPKAIKTDEGHVVLDAVISGMKMGITLIGKTEG